MLDVVGKLKKVIWRSLENDFTIASFVPEEGGFEFIATGDLFNPAEGIIYEMSGDWTDHPKYGKQLKIDCYRVREPVNSDAIATFLEKYVKGVGPVMAGKLIELYGKGTIQILKKTPERVSNENKGISYDLALKISEQLNEEDKQRDVLIQLEGLFSKVKGLPRNLAQNIIRLHGILAYEVVKNNPYQLVEMNRIGFVTADKVGMACGVKHDDEQRIRAGMLHVIGQSMQESGDIWLSFNNVYDSLSGLIVDSKASVFARMLAKLVKEKVLVKDYGFVTLTQNADDESLIADCVGRFLV